MDVSQLKESELIALAFGINSKQAEDAMDLFFPNRGQHFAMDRKNEDLRERLKAAVEIDRRMARRQLETCQSPIEAKSLIRRVIGSQEHESFWVLFLDSQVRVISSVEMSIGTAAQCSVYPREIVKKALALNACSVMLAHNHPSGECRPSRADENLTQSIKSALALVDVRVLDHFIVNRDCVASMAEMGLV